MKTQKVLTADLENMHSELENVTRSKTLVLYLPQPHREEQAHGLVLACGGHSLGKETLRMWASP